MHQLRRTPFAAPVCVCPSETDSVPHPACDMQETAGNATERFPAECTFAPLPLLQSTGCLTRRLHPNLGSQLDGKSLLRLSLGGPPVLVPAFPGLAVQVSEQLVTDKPSGQLVRVAVECYGRATHEGFVGCVCCMQTTAVLNRHQKASELSIHQRVNARRNGCENEHASGERMLIPATACLAKANVRGHPTKLVCSSPQSDICTGLSRLPCPAGGRRRRAFSRSPSCLYRERTGPMQASRQRLCRRDMLQASGRRLV